MADNINDKGMQKDLASFFENYIKTGVVRKEAMIAPNIFVRLHALNVEEILQAEMNVMKAAEGLTIDDVFLRLRACAILALAIERLGDKDLYTQEEIEGLSEDAVRSKLQTQAGVYSILMKLPPALVMKMYDLYVEAVNEQNSYYENAGEIIEKSENFSKHPTEE